MSRKRDRPSRIHPGPRKGGARIHALRAPSSEIAGLRGSFLAWLDEHGLPPQVDVGALWADAVAAVDLAVAAASLHDLHRWTPDQVTAVQEAAGEEDGGLVAALPLLLGFLAATGRWNGTPAEFHAVLEVADTDPLATVLDELAAVQVDDDEEDAALQALPVVGQAEALLRFLLPRRAVTGTGALRRADLATAAGLVGVDLGGHRPRSMWDVARLPDVWSALADVGLVTVTATAAVPTPVASAWLTGDEAAGRRARRMVLGGYLVAVLAQPSPVAFLPDPLETLLPALAAAALGRPLRSEHLLGTGDLDDPRNGGGALLAGFAALAARGVLESLAAEGILDVAGTISVPPALRRVVARTAAALLTGAQTPDDPEPAPRGDAAGTGSAWRIRVAIADTEPPVWREALVDPAIPLDRLHEVIQRLFGWEGSHLHEFTASPRRGRTVRYAPPDPDDDWPVAGGEAEPEAGVRLDLVLGPRRGRLTYRYDFGDCWDHLVTVVGTEPPGGPLPRCVAGSGAAPQEDSGGAWGWTEKVAAANDPRHPDHQDVRAWLGLPPGEALDPAAFDLADTDSWLADLRS